MCSRKLKRCSSVSALEYHSMVLSQQLAPVHREPITSHPLDIHTITGVQRMKFLFHPISPPSQCQAADLGCPVWSDGLGGGASKSDTCMLPTSPISILARPPRPTRGTTEKPIFWFHFREAEVPPWGQRALRINCYLLCLSDTGNPVQGGHGQWVLIHFNHHPWKELLSWRGRSVVRSRKDKLWVSKGGKK